MQTPSGSQPGTSSAADRSGPTAVTGFMLGLFGYLAGLVVFGYEGFFAGGGDAHDQLAGALALADGVAVATSIAAAIVILRSWRHRRRAAAGLASGAMVGVVLMLVLTVRVLTSCRTWERTVPASPS